MCGIVGAITHSDVVPLLLQGLQRLEYRGYDSAGLAVLDDAGALHLRRTVGKVACLSEALRTQPLSGATGIAHTRWATHGAATVANAHPHVSSGIALVHNGIIENHQALRAELATHGCRFASDTDSEVIAVLIAYLRSTGQPLLQAVRAAVARLEGAYALAVITSGEEGRLLAARRGSPLGIGLGEHGHYVASDAMALLPLARRCLFLEDGDVAEVGRGSLQVHAADGTPVQRPVRELVADAEQADRGGFAHFMLKEIHEQPQVLRATLQNALEQGQVAAAAFGARAAQLLPRVRALQVVACGTSYHAGMVGSRWIEELAGIPCRTDLASEFRYAPLGVTEGTLCLLLSQSGETADTLAALRRAQEENYLGTAAICNVAESALAREAEMVFLTRAGIEVGVASTKAFTAQLTALLLLALLLAREGRGDGLLDGLRALPTTLQQTLTLEDRIRGLAERLAAHRHALYLGRGLLWPLAMEGALKLKEIAYIYAEAHAAGELKHGPLALVDETVPVVALLARDALRGKLTANLSEVCARGGHLLVLAQAAEALDLGHGHEILPVPATPALLAPFVFTLPLQLLAYHTAVALDTDVDQPRNLAKSVTVE